jgi:hypothetical protein
MVEHQHSSAILSRNIDGDEFLLTVTGHAGLIALEDQSGMSRIMTPSAASQLGLDLLFAAGKHLPVLPGPLSGRF